MIKDYVTAKERVSFKKKSWGIFKNGNAMLLRKVRV